MISSKIIHPYKIKVSKKKKNRYKSNQEDQIKEKSLCASWCWTGKNIILDQVTKPVSFFHFNSRLMSLNASSSLFSSVLKLLKRNIWLPFVVRNKRRNLRSVGASLGPSQPPAAASVFSLSREVQKSVLIQTQRRVRPSTRSLAPLIRWWPSLPPPGWRRRWSAGSWAAAGSGCVRWCIRSGGSE